MRTPFASPIVCRALTPALLVTLAAACTAARTNVAPVRSSSEAAPIVAIPVESVHLPRGTCAPLALPSSDRELDFLRPQELRAQPMPDLLSLLRHRRPLWLNARASSINIAQPVLVYLNGAQLGGLEVLSTIPVRDVYIARHVRPMAAVQRYGTGHAGGVIELYTKC